MPNISSLFALMRPRQWSKNVLLMAAPFGAGDLFTGHEIRQVTKAFIAFSFVSSACYIINDIRDAENDRLNVIKKNRPIASRKVTVNQALILSGLLSLLGFYMATLLPKNFLLVLFAYFIMTNLYSFGLKNQPVIEFVIVAFGFAFRAIAGGSATDVPVTKWFLVVTGFGSLIIVISKRIAEGENSSHTSTRKVLLAYPPGFLNLILAIAASTTLTAYSLWSFSLSQAHPYAQISLIPVTIGLFRYIWLVSYGHGESPEDLLFKDLYLILCGITIAILLLLTFYPSVSQ